MTFQYTTISYLRSIGIDESIHNDAELDRLIKYYSRKVSLLLERTFTPSLNKVLLDGGSQLYKIQGSPILKINDIGFSSGGYRSVVGPSEYAIHDNTLLSFSRPFSRGLGAIEVNVIQGELENRKDIQIITLTPISSGTTEVSVNNVDDLEARDIFFYQNNSYIINEIDYANHVIKIDDPGHIKPIPAGSILAIYGQVPLLIEEAVALFIQNHQYSRKQKTGFKSEKIGNYSYTKDDTVQSLTGISEIDSILSLYMRDDISIDFL